MNRLFILTGFSFGMLKQRVGLSSHTPYSSMDSPAHLAAPNSFKLQREESMTSFHSATHSLSSMAEGTNSARGTLDNICRFYSLCLCAYFMFLGPQFEDFLLSPTKVYTEV